MGSSSVAVSGKCLGLNVESIHRRMRLGVKCSNECVTSGMQYTVNVLQVRSLEAVTLGTTPILGCTLVPHHVCNVDASEYAKLQYFGGTMSTLTMVKTRPRPHSSAEVCVSDASIHMVPLVHLCVFVSVIDAISTVAQFCKLIIHLTRVFYILHSS